MLTRSQVARELSVSLTTLSKLLHSRELFSIKIGADYRIPREAVDAFKLGRPYPPPELAHALDASRMDSPDLRTWPPTPSMLARLDGRAPELDEQQRQADDDAAAVLAAGHRLAGEAQQ